jgi:ATP synthase protein I
MRPQFGAFPLTHAGAIRYHLMPSWLGAGTAGPGGERAEPVAEEPFSERLKRLEDRIAAAKAAREEPKRAHRKEFTQGSLAWRMVTELVVGMLLGLAMGYGLDALFGTRPVFLVVFVLLGFAGGVRTMLRTAEEVRRGRGEAALMGDGTEGPDRE